MHGVIILRGKAQCICSMSTHTYIIKGTYSDTLQVYISMCMRAWLHKERTLSKTWLLLLYSMHRPLIIKLLQKHQQDRLSIINKALKGSFVHVGGQASQVVTAILNCIHACTCTHSMHKLNRSKQCEFTDVSRGQMVNSRCTINFMIAKYRYQE